MAQHFDTQRETAIALDQNDPLASFKQEFYFPQHNGADTIYFCGNSLGLQAKSVQDAVQQELEDWKNYAIAGFTKARYPWMQYQEGFKSSLAKVLGCLETEVTIMNGLTVNLHFLMTSFYKPEHGRYKILMEAGAFPSDQYAVETQVKLAGYDPADAIIEVSPRDGEKILRTEDILHVIEENVDTIAIVLFGGINYYSGQVFDMKAITAKAHEAGALAAFDLAHAAGNVLLQLHDWNVDFAVWCNYKYLNGGPGAVGGAYVHERFATDPETPRMAGWWGNDESSRFKMEKGFIAKPNASGWNVSTAQVLNMASLRASLEMFDQAGIEKLRAKSVLLTGYLEYLLHQLKNIKFQIITPADPEARGAQLSLYFTERGKEIHAKMLDNGIIVDYREPGVIRVAPAPMYCSFEDVYRFYEILQSMD